MASNTGRKTTDRNTNDDDDDEDDDAAERRTFAKPDEPGKQDGEVRDGFRWDRAANDWMDHRGIDFSEDASQLPHNMEHVGDGSPQKPHTVRHVQRWS